MHDVPDSSAWRGALSAQQRTLSGTRSDDQSDSIRLHVCMQAYLAWAEAAVHVLTSPTPGLLKA